MQPQFQMTGQATGELEIVRNRVLRNTYMLLALSMIPTVLGAFIGVKMGLGYLLGGSWMSLLVFFGIAFGLIWGIERTKESAVGVVLLLAFTFFMGIMLSGILGVALGYSNGAFLIGTAATGTGAIFFTMAGIATVTKRDYSFMGKFLFVGLVVLILASIGNIFFQMPAMTLTISVVAVLLFSMYILYDISRIVNGGETNYISATLSVYLSVYNIFVNLLRILMMLAGQRD